MKVAVVYNLRREVRQVGGPGVGFAGRDAEYDTGETVEALLAEVARLGHDARGVEADLDCLGRLRADRPDLVFNIAEGLPGPSREAQVPALCEMLRLPHTGSGVLTLSLCLDKATARRVLRDAGVAVPAGRSVPPGGEAVAGDLRFPLFVKPQREGSSMGITEDSLVRDEAALARQVRRVHEAYGEPALVEEFLPGREFTVGLLGEGGRTALPITEIVFAEAPPGYPPVYTYRFKREWDDARFYACPAPLEGPFAAAVPDAARAAFRALGCADVARIDLRLDAAGRPHCIDVNPLPGMAPGFSDLPRQADAAGIGYRGLVRAILEAAIRRHGL